MRYPTLPAGSEFDVPATRTALRQSPTAIQVALAKSLACYCSGDDIDLERSDFLTYVRDRITMHLEQGEY